MYVFNIVTQLRSGVGIKIVERARHRPLQRNRSPVVQVGGANRGQFVLAVHEYAKMMMAQSEGFVIRNPTGIEAGLIIDRLNQFNHCPAGEGEAQLHEGGKVERAECTRSEAVLEYRRGRSN